jgi:dihydroxyacetone kinase
VHISEISLIRQAIETLCTIPGKKWAKTEEKKRGEKIARPRTGDFCDSENMSGISIKF